MEIKVPLPNFFKPHDLPCPLPIRAKEAAGWMGACPDSGQAGEEGDLAGAGNE